MTKYQVHVHGPDDVMDASDEADAQRQVDEINDLNLKLVEAHIIVDGEFPCHVHGIAEEALKGVAIAVDDYTDVVLNDNDRDELARIVLDGLTEAGYKVVQAQNA